MKDSLRDKLERLMEALMDDGINAEDSSERKECLKISGSIFVQLAKIDAKMDDDDEEEKNFGSWQQKMAQAEGRKN